LERFSFFVIHTGLDDGFDETVPGVIPESVNDVGDMALGIDGQWMVRPPERCAQGHLLVGNCIVAAQPCRCQDRHMSWCCETCSHVTYGPALGENCSLLHGPARVR
jgi:hypothetical protein